jgi:hypothetical protein
MSRSSIRYKCNACGAITPRDALVSGSWGDRCCPTCASPNVERHRTRWEAAYATFFLYKVF